MAYVFTATTVLYLTGNSDGYLPLLKNTKIRMDKGMPIQTAQKTRTISFMLKVRILRNQRLFDTKNISHNLGDNGALLRNGCFEEDKTVGGVRFRFRN